MSYILCPNGLSSDVANAKVIADQLLLRWTRTAACFNMLKVYRLVDPLILECPHMRSLYQTRTFTHLIASHSKSNKSNYLITTYTIARTHNPEHRHRAIYKINHHQQYHDTPHPTQANLTTTSNLKMYRPMYTSPLTRECIPWSQLSFKERMNSDEAKIDLRNLNIMIFFVLPMLFMFCALGYYRRRGDWYKRRVQALEEGIEKMDKGQQDWVDLGPNLEGRKKLIRQLEEGRRWCEDMVQHYRSNDVLQ